MVDPPKRRRALSHVGGPARQAGDRAVAEELARALDVPTSLEAEELARAHVHGFHAYPARMHPSTARRLVEAFSSSGSRVLDPFCGSGTVLVEARLLGREAVGVDLNPLAARLARLKVRGSTEPERARLVSASLEVAAHADARRKAKTGPSRRYDRKDVELFAPHVLLELDGIRLGIDAVADAWTRDVLELVLSSILTKVSRKSSDTSEHATEKRIAAGYPARLFVKKTEELGRLLEAVAPLFTGAPAPTVSVGDARELGAVARGSVGLVATSPPYPGNYDYLAHHAARLRWLRMNPVSLERSELGARRHLEPLGPAEGSRRWATEMTAVLRAIAPALAPSGRVAILIADSVIAGMPVFALDLLQRVSPAIGFAVVASASQPRPHFHGPTARAFARRPREEHLLILAKR